MGFLTSPTTKTLVVPLTLPAHPSISTGEALSAILKSLNWRRSLEPSQRAWSSSYNRLDLSAGRRIITCSTSERVVSFPLVVATVGHQEAVEEHLEKIHWYWSHQPKPIVDSCWEPWRWCLTSNHVVYSIENTRRTTLKDERHRRRNCNTTSSTAATVTAPVNHLVTKSATNGPTSWSSFYEVYHDIYIYIYIYRVTPKKQNP